MKNFILTEPMNINLINLINLINHTNHRKRAKNAMLPTRHKKRGAVVDSSGLIGNNLVLADSV